VKSPKHAITIPANNEIILSLSQSIKKTITLRITKLNAGIGDDNNFSKFIKSIPSPLIYKTYT
jgi:hypothetical protein